MPDREVPPSLPEPVVIEGHEEFEVEEILDKHTHRRRTEYLVKWVGYPAYDATWEPLTHLTNASKAIAEFEGERWGIDMSEISNAEAIDVDQPPGWPLCHFCPILERGGDVTDQTGATLRVDQPPQSLRTGKYADVLTCSR